MLDSALEIIKWIAAITGVIYVISAYRAARAKHPVFQYDQHSAANQHDWRWRRPDEELALQLLDDEQKSCLTLPTEAKLFEKCIVAGGVLFQVLAVFMLVFVLFKRGAAEAMAGLFPMLLIFWLGHAMLRVGARACQVILYPDHLVVVETHAILLKRIYTFQHGPKLQFHGALQSMFTMTSYQEEPEYKLTIERPNFLFFTKKKRFWLQINQSQGSWLVAGLQAWHERNSVKAPG